jgi:hypothetical protein
MNNLNYTFDQARSKFEYLEAHDMKEYSGYIHDFKIGWVEGFPACLLGTELVHHQRNNNVSGKEAVDKIQEALKDENVLLIYPENYQEMTVENKGAHCTTEIMVIADNLADFGRALLKLPSHAASVTGRELVEGTIIQQKTEDWIGKLKVA